MQKKIIDIYDTIKDGKFFFNFSYQGKEYSFDTIPITIDNNPSIFFKPIILKNRVFDFNRTNISVDLVCTKKDKPPCIWTNTKFEVIKLDKKTYVYRFCGLREGCEINRRNHFRMYVGSYGEAQIGPNTTPIPVIIKDISASGIAFITSVDKKISRDTDIHLTFKDTKINKKFNIHTKAIRKTEVSEGRYVYGCYLGKEIPEIEQYIQERQRFDLKCRKYGETKHVL